MPSKVKGLSGKEGLGTGIGDVKDIAYFQDAFGTYKRKPEDSMKKNSLLAELEKLSNVDNRDISRLAALCRARIQYDYCICKKDFKCLSRLRADAAGRLSKMLKETPRSLSAACLLASWYKKGASGMVDSWSVALKGIENIRKDCALKEDLDAADWEDPADEAINSTDSKEKFENFKDGRTKEERLKCLAGYFDRLARKVKDKAESCPMMLHKQPADESPVTQQQSGDDTGQQSDVELERKAWEARRDTWTNTVAHQEGLDREVARIMDAIGGKLDAAGPEGSSDRVLALCDLFTTAIQDFQNEIMAQFKKDMDGYPENVVAKLAGSYEQGLASQLARSRANGELLLLRSQDLRELIKCSYSSRVEVVPVATAAKIADGKDVKGDVAGSGKVNPKKKGTKGSSVKDQDKKAPAALVDSAPPLSAHDFLALFVSMLKEQGSEICARIIDEVDTDTHSYLARIPGAEAEVEEFRKCKNTGPCLHDVFMLQVKIPGSEMESSLASEVTYQTRHGDVLLTESMAPEPYTMDAMWSSKLETQRQRVEFARQLKAIPILQRHDIFAAIASRVASMVALSEEKGGDLKMVPATFDIPLTPEEVAVRLEDPIIMLAGYIHLQRHRNLLPLSEEVHKACSNDADVRLLRLCDHLLYIQEDRAREFILLGMTFIESEKPEHIEMLRRLYGELPKALIAHQQQENETLEKGLNGSTVADVDVNAIALRDLEAGCQGADLSGGAGPVVAADGEASVCRMEFVVRQDLASEERAALDESWREDIIDAVATLQAGGCGLGRCLSNTIAAFISEALNVPHQSVDLSDQALPTWVAKLNTEQLLHLRYFMLHQLGRRGDAIVTSMEDRVSRWGRICKEELWGLQVVEGDKIRPSKEWCSITANQSRNMRRMRVLRLRTLHAMKRMIVESRGGAEASGAASAPASAANGVLAASQQAAGSKKKGKGGGASSSGAAAAAQASKVVLPMLPPGESPLEDTSPVELFDFFPAKHLDEQKLLHLINHPEFICARELKEHMNLVIHPEKWTAHPLQVTSGEALVVEAILSPASEKPKSSDYQPHPTFTLMDILEDLTRASVLEVVREKAMRSFNCALEDLLHEWGGLLGEFKAAGDEQYREFVGELEPRVSSWLRALSDKAGVRHEGEPLVKRLARLEQIKYKLVASAFLLESRVVRFSVMNYRVRIKTITRIADELAAATKPKLASQSQSSSEPVQGREVAKAHRRQNKSRQGQNAAQTPSEEVESPYQNDLNVEQMSTDVEKVQLKEVLHEADKHADDVLIFALDMNELALPRDGDVHSPSSRLLPNRYSETPQGAAQLLLSTLQAAQHLALIYVVLESVIEDVQVQARTNMSSAMLNHPVLDSGVIGLNLIQSWLKKKLLDVAQHLTAKRLEEALIAKENKEKQDKEAKKRQDERKKRQDERKKEEEDARKREQEEEEAREREAVEARKVQEQEEQDARKRRAVEEEERLAAERKAVEKPKRNMLNLLEDAQYNIDVNTLEPEEPAAKVAAEKQRAQQPSGRGTGEVPSGARKEPMSARPNKEKEQQQQRQPFPSTGGYRGRRSGGGGGPAIASAGTKRDNTQRKGSSGQQHPQQGQQVQQGKPKEGATGFSMGTPAAGSVAAIAPQGHGRGIQAPVGPGKGDRRGPPSAQQQHHHHHRGGSGAGVCKGFPQGVSQAPQLKSVPGFDLDGYPQSSDAKVRHLRRRNKGGAAGQGESAPPSSTVQRSGATGAIGWGEITPVSGTSNERPHPPVATNSEGGVAVVDLTEPEAGQEVDKQAQQVDTDDSAVDEQESQYAYVRPYPFEPPPGWKVVDGYLYPEDQNLEALTQEGMAAAPDISSPAAAERYRQVYMVALANSFLNDPERQMPSVPPEAYKSFKPEQPFAMPYAVSVEASADYNRQQHHPEQVEGQAPVPAFGSLQSLYEVGIPPFQTGAPPAPWSQFPGVPLPMPPYMPPQFPRLAVLPPTTMPPFPSVPPVLFPYAVPQPVRPPPAPAPIPVLPEPHGESDDEEQVTEDLLGLLGVQQQPRLAAPAVAALPGPMPVVLPAAAYLPFAPGLHGFALSASPVPPYTDELSKMDGIVVQSAIEPNMHSVQWAPIDEDLLPPPAVAPSTPQAHPEQGAAPTGAPVLSWADRARGAAGQAALLSLRQASPRGFVLAHDTSEELPDTEEKQVRAVMYQSALDSMHVAFPPLGVTVGAAAGYQVALPPPAAAAGTGQEVALAPGGAVGTGLVNRVGEYNCFLNVIIQCLWHCVAFRQQLQTHNPADFDAEHPVVAALLRLFRALDLADETREQQHQQLAHSEEAVERHVVDPSELRVALDELGVRAGEMNDASEVMSALFESLNRAPGLSGADLTAATAGGGLDTLPVVDRTFGLLLSEEVRCTVPTCCRITHVVPQHIEYFIIITATGLRDMRSIIDLDPADVTMASIIREIEAQNVKRCDSDPPHYGCNTPTSVTRTLHNVPSVFTVQLAWEPDVPGDAIAGTLALVDTLLDPKQIFTGGNCPGNMPIYALHGMFCYYGQHYFAFINRGPIAPDMEDEWVMFDDATVLTVGNWGQVIAKCRAGRIQPSVLFYQLYR